MNINYAVILCCTCILSFALPMDSNPQNFYDPCVNPCIELIEQTLDDLTDRTTTNEQKIEALTISLNQLRALLIESMQNTPTQISLLEILTSHASFSPVLRIKVNDHLKQYAADGLFPHTASQPSWKNIPEQFYPYIKDDDRTVWMGDNNDVWGYDGRGKLFHIDSNFVRVTA